MSGSSVWRFVTQTHPLIAAVVLAILVGTVDALTGTRLRVYPLYFIPVALVASSYSRASGVVAAVVGSGVWAISTFDLEYPRTSIANIFSQFVAFVLVVILVNLQKTRADLQERLASVDGLTGLMNSRSFYQSVMSELSRQRRTNRPLTIAYLDIDDFKLVNTALGHVGADHLLQAVAQSMKQALRLSDDVGRLGGDEFAILLPETSETQAMEVLNRIRSRVHANTSSQHRPVTLSIGAVTFSQTAESVETMMRLADAQMYQVKGRHKNDVQVSNAHDLLLA